MGNMNFTKEEMICSIDNLSGGSKAKLILLKLILDKCDVLLLDEPTRNVSPLSNPIIRASLKKYGGTIISISHDRKYINEVCNKIYELILSGIKSVDI
jgi:ATPase subunit of ABC transporter with duplicated ATPase domains